MMAAAPYPRTEVSGESIEGVCLYRAKTFCTQCLTHVQKKRAPWKVPAPILKVRFNLSTIVEICVVFSIPAQNDAKVNILFDPTNYFWEF